MNYHLALRRIGWRRIVEVAAAITIVVIAAWCAGSWPPGPSGQLARAQVDSLANGSATVTLLDGPAKGSVKTIDAPYIAPYSHIQKGSIVLVGEASGELLVVDTYRLPALIVICIVFVIVVLLVGRRRGASSLIGLGVSGIVIVWVVIPMITGGGNALLVCGGAAYLIAFSSIIIAHGVRRRTVIAIGIVALLLLLVVTGDALAVRTLGLSGATDEAAYFLTVKVPYLNLAELVSGGLIIASLGALDDIVLSQVAAVDELHEANQTLSVRELYRRSLSIGREHIASLVNTLVLLYAGASLPTLISMVGSAVNPVTLFNSEYIVTVIIQAVLPGIALVIAVPFASIIAALILTRDGIFRRGRSTVRGKVVRRGLAGRGGGGRREG